MEMGQHETHKSHTYRVLGAPQYCFHFVFYLLGLTWPYWALLGPTGPYWAYWALLSLTGTYWALLAHIALTLHLSN